MPEHHLLDPNEVTCRDFVELVTDFLEGALPADRVELVEEHLVICDPCKAYLDQIEATVAALPGAAEGEQLPAATRESLLERFRTWSAGR